MDYRPGSASYRRWGEATYCPSCILSPFTEVLAQGGLTTPSDLSAGLPGYIGKHKTAALA